MTVNNVERVKTMVRSVLVEEADIPTTEKIANLVKQTSQAFGVSEKDQKVLVRHFEYIHGVSMGIGTVLVGEEFKPWLDRERSKIDPYYWDRYRNLLGQKNLSHQVIGSVNESTDRILDHLENPNKTGSWQRRGMVIGHVQSGKTANYVGLICKAADAGYKVVIVIAGIHNNLRNQTQKRIDEGFIGFDSTKALENSSKLVGVGKINPNSQRHPSSFTNSLQDFRKSAANAVKGISIHNLNEPVVFVIKKNASTLQNLLEWLKDSNAKHDKNSVDYPMILIDDEADNASINIAKGRDEVSRINGQIRELLRTFSRSSYVGYTATPFANIFIDPDTEDAMHGEDLFPRDFIVCLDPPSNYFGPQRVFSEPENNNFDFVRFIDDNEDCLPIDHKIDFQVQKLPFSLRTAVRTFVIGIAIRIARSDKTAHNSMLINASRFVAVQRQLRNEIHEFVENLRNSIRINCKLPHEEANLDPEFSGLHNLFEREFARKCSVPWEEVCKHLHDGIGKMKVVEVNKNSTGSLNYSEYENIGLNVIAVGGFSLSRGLTLEGLSISYFLRRSMTYDTLMQMARWFGYRDNYEDVCRIWVLEESAGWYAHISESIEELREEIKAMERAGATPKQFGLKVRSHPSSLVVTARNKSGSGTLHALRLGFSNKFIETHALSGREQDLTLNRKAVKNLLSILQQTNSTPELLASKGWLATNIEFKTVREFLSRFRNHSESQLTETEQILQYIESHSSNELKLWDIFFPSIKKPSDGTLIDKEILGFEISCQRRTLGNSSNSEVLYIGNNRKVSPQKIEKIGLSPEQIREAECYHFRKTTKSYRESFSNPTPCPDRYYRKFRSKPLLIIHLLSLTNRDNTPVPIYDKPVIAWSISFPEIENEERVEYVVNTAWAKQNLFEYDNDADGEE